MVEGSSTAVTMLGLAGVVVLAVNEIVGEIETAVDTISTRAWCRDCGVRAVGYGRRVGRDNTSVVVVARDWGTIHDAQTALAEFYAWAHSCAVPETARLARTVRHGKDAPATASAPSATTDSASYCTAGVTWHDQLAARLRQRQPRSAA